MHEEGSIGARLREVRMTAGLTMKAFAEVLGITQAHVSNVERGVSRPSKALLKAISTKYHYRLEWLETGAEPKSFSHTVAAAIDAAQRGPAGLEQAKDIIQDAVQAEVLRQVFLPLLKQNDPLVDPRLSAIFDFFDSMWNEADEKHRAWIEVQLERAFPEFEEFSRQKLKPEDDAEKNQQ